MIADAAGRAIGPGWLVLVVGPSGAGKDTLIDLARTRCQGSEVVFVRRVVTRAGSDYENNAQLSIAEFCDEVTRDAFALHWQAHGHHYGLPRSIDADIEAGRTVVANVSRTVIARARRSYRNVAVVLITAPADVLAMRLAARARDSDGNVKQRLQRTIDETVVVPDLTIVNVNGPEIHVKDLVDVIERSVSF